MLFRSGFAKEAISSRGLRRKLEKRGRTGERAGFLAFKFDYSEDRGTGQHRIYPAAGLSPQSTEFTKRKKKRTKKRKRKATATIFVKEDISTLHKRGHFYFALTPIKKNIDTILRESYTTADNKVVRSGRKWES